jgi:hypothetical protein|tara:strand:+ start:151 stop:855 length:705 start_codon:yes stop_codon:yes gene_type:complete
MRRKIRKFRGGGMDAGAGSDFKSPSVSASVNKGSDHSHSRFETGSGYYGETPTNTGGGKGTTITNNPPPAATTKSKGVNPVTTGLNIAGALIGKVPFVGYAVEAASNLQKKARLQTAKGEDILGRTKKGNAGMPITRDYYRTTGKPLDVTSPAGKSYMKDAGLLKNPTPPTGGDNNNNMPGLCPDGSSPPCKIPTTQIAKTFKRGPGSDFLKDFRAYDEGGEVIISGNVDKDLL